MYAQEKIITLPIGLRDPAAPDAPPARQVKVRMPTISDELWAQAERSRLAGSQLTQDREFAEAPMSADVLFAARLIVGWEGVPAYTWRDVVRLARADWNALMAGIASLETEAAQAVAKLDAQGELAPL